MNYTERIKGIANAIHLMGGTSVYFKDKEFCFAQERTYNTKRMMWLKEITPNDLVFGDENTTFVMPIDNFSEMFLANVFASYVAECREQLTDEGFKRIERFV